MRTSLEKFTKNWANLHTCESYFAPSRCGLWVQTATPPWEWRLKRNRTCTHRTGFKNVVSWSSDRGKELLGGVEDEFLLENDGVSTAVPYTRAQVSTLSHGSSHC